MSGAIFAADPPAQRRTVSLDGLTLIYHLPSGATHVVAPPIPEMLALLSAAPADAAGLLRRLAATYDLDAGEDGPATIAARLAELEASGLVFRA